MTRPGRVLLSALIGLLVGGAVAYALFRPAAAPTLTGPSTLRPFPLARAPAPPLTARRPAPQFAVESLRGGTVRLADFRGKVVLLNFFASWCAPCAAEAPDLEATYQRYRSRNVEFVAVAVLDDFAAARDFVRRHRLSYPAAFDRSNRVMEDYEVTGLPTSVFIDAAGMITGRFVGPFVGPAGVAELERRLAEAVTRPPAP